MLPRIAAAAVLALLAAVPLRAQSVRGEFVDAAGAPVPSGRVLLQTESGRVVHSALTDDAGAFSLRAPRAGRYVVRGERIGYGATLSPPLELAADEQATYRLVASRERVLLDAIVVESRPRCAVRPGASEETAAVWGEVRKALDLVNEGAGEAQRGRFTVDLFEREVDTRTRAVNVLSTRTSAGLAHRPFVTLPPERLAREGFIIRDTSGMVYAAPDAEILLSDGFLDNHCFRLRTAGAPEPGLIGLAFEPVRGRRVPDVEGVLWLDRASAELRRMEFEYTRAPLRGDRGVPGGQVEFQRLPDGRWITSSWVVRMPVQAENPHSDPRLRRRPRIVAVREVGGAVRVNGAAAGP